jgi:hypothetical protein
VPSPDFADQTITRLGLTGQRLETAGRSRRPATCGSTRPPASPVRFA